MATNNQPNNDLFHYVYYDIWESNGDSRVSQFPFMKGGPWTMISVVITYGNFRSLYVSVSSLTLIVNYYNNFYI